MANRINSQPREAQHRPDTATLGLHHLHLRLNRSTQRRHDRARQRRQLPDLGRQGIRQGHPATHLILHLAQLRSGRLRMFYAADPRRHDHHRRQCAELIGTNRRRHPDQHRAVGNRCSGQGRRSPRRHAHHQPGRGSTQKESGRYAVCQDHGRYHLQPLWPVRDDHIFNLGRHATSGRLSAPHR